MQNDDFKHLLTMNRIPPEYVTWRELLRITGPQLVVSTVARRIGGQEVVIKQCMEPEEKLAAIYAKLNMKSLPLKRRQKICVVHSCKSKKKILKNQRVRYL